MPLWLLLALLLAACDAGTTSGVSAPTATATSTVIATLPTPTNVPAGWQVFAPPPGLVSHFTIAYPAGWTERFVPTLPNGHSTSGSYTFATPGDNQFVVVYEGDGLDSATMQRNCSSPYATHVTYAGLPMLYSLDANGMVRDYAFLTEQGVSYQLLSDAKAPAATQAFYDSIFATFRPQYTTPACK